MSHMLGQTGVRARFLCSSYSCAMVYVILSSSCVKCKYVISRKKAVWWVSENSASRDRILGSET